jgi:G3E family GTPase
LAEAYGSIRRQGIRRLDHHGGRRRRFCLDWFESKAAHNQLCHGDVILLNKCDLVDAARLRTIEDAIRTLKPQARILRTTQCRVALPLLLSVGLFQSDRFFADPKAAHAHDHETHQNSLIFPL